MTDKLTTQQPRYEYIRIGIDIGDLSELNRFGSAGWHVVAFMQYDQQDFLLLQREAPDEP